MTMLSASVSLPCLDAITEHPHAVCGEARLTALAAALLFAVVGGLPIQSSAQAAKNDIWGKGNDFSNAQGGVSRPAEPAPAIPSGKVPNTAAWKATCQDHFRDLPTRDRRKREEIDRLFHDTASREREWGKYATTRDGLANGCANTWPSEFSRASAEAGIRAADPGRGGECREFTQTIPASCSEFVVAARGVSTNNSTFYVIQLFDRSEWRFSGDYNTGLRWACEQGVGTIQPGTSATAASDVRRMSAAAREGNMRDAVRKFQRGNNPYGFAPARRDPTGWCGVRG